MALASGQTALCCPPTARFLGTSTSTSPQARFDRFLSAVPHLSDKMLEHLVDDVDSVDHVALMLLVTTESGTELPVGVARIIRYPDGATAADVAVTVVDGWRGRGVATALLAVLMRKRPKSVERIVTVINASSAASLAMLRRLGEGEVSQVESGTEQVVVELSGSADRPTAGPRRDRAARRSRRGVGEAMVRQA